MSSDANESSPASLFKRSINKKPRSRRERSPLRDQHDGGMSRSTENAGQPSTSSVELSPMTQVAKIKARHKSRQKMQGPSFGAEGSDVSRATISPICLFILHAALADYLTELSSTSPLDWRRIPGEKAHSQSLSLSCKLPSGLHSKSYLLELKASTQSTLSFRQRALDQSIDAESDMSMVYEHTNDSLASAPRPFYCLYMIMTVSRKMK